MARKIYLFLIALILIIVDQVSKFLFEGVNIVIIPNILSFIYTQNSGAAFGMMQGYNILFTIVTIIVVALLLYYFNKFGSDAGALLLLSGAAANLIDRMFFGYVRDFISISIWPTFNFADAFGVIGVLLIAYMSFKKKYFS